MKIFVIINLNSKIIFINIPIAFLFTSNIQYLNDILIEIIT